MWTVNPVPHPSIQAVPSNWLSLLCSVLNDELTLRAVKMMMIRNRYRYIVPCVPAAIVHVFGLVAWWVPNVEVIAM